MSAESTAKRLIRVAQPRNSSHMRWNRRLLEEFGHCCMRPLAVAWICRRKKCKGFGLKCPKLLHLNRANGP